MVSCSIAVQNASSTSTESRLNAPVEYREEPHLLSILTIDHRPPQLRRLVGKQGKRKTVRLFVFMHLLLLGK